MEMSQAINELAAALAQAQAEMGAAVKDAANPFYKSKYADLASVRDACVPALTKHGLSVMQSPSADGAVVSVTTLLMHSSGQWVRGVASCTAKDDSPQAVGSATTYLRRYALQSFAGVAPEDDDGNGAQRRADATTHEPVIQIRRDTKAEPAIPTQVTGRREGGVTDAPGTIGLPALSTREPGEDDELPAGFELIHDVKVDRNFWHVYWSRDAQGGFMLYKTKLQKVADAAQDAFRDRVAVRLHSKKLPWLDSVERLDATA